MSSNVRAIVLMILAMIGFGVDDAAIKLAGTLSGNAAATPGEIVVIKGVFGAIIFAMFVAREGHNVTLSFVRRMMLDRANIFRMTGDLVGAMAIITGLTVMPISNLSAIIQVQPLVITLGAALILGESVGWRRWTAILVGFFGVLLIIQPGMDGFESGTHWAILAMLALAMRDLATRVVKPEFPTSILLLTVAILLIPLGAGMHLTMESERFFEGISATAWALILGGAVFGIIAYYAITLSVRLAEISIVAPYRYTRLVVAIILGFFIFGEVPDLPMIVGATLVIGAGLFTLYRERALRQESQQPHNSG